MRGYIKEIHQLDHEGNFLRKFPSIKEALSFVGGKSKTNIMHATYSKGIAYNYRWKALYEPFKGGMSSQKNQELLEQDVIDEWLRSINGEAKNRRCIGIKENGDHCKRVFLSRGNYERKCPRCKAREASLRTEPIVRTVKIGSLA